MRIFVGTWVQYLFPLFGVDDTKFVPPDNKLCKGDNVRDVLVFVPSNNGCCTKAPVEEAGKYPYGVLIIEMSELITVYKGEDFDANHVISGLLGTFYL